MVQVHPRPFRQRPSREPRMRKIVNWTSWYRSMILKGSARADTEGKERIYTTALWSPYCVLLSFRVGCIAPPFKSPNEARGFKGPTLSYHTGTHFLRVGEIPTKMYSNALSHVPFRVQHLLKRCYLYCHLQT